MMSSLLLLGFDCMKLESLEFIWYILSEFSSSRLMTISSWGKKKVKLASYMNWRENTSVL